MKSGQDWFGVVLQCKARKSYLFILKVRVTARCCPVELGEALWLLGRVRSGKARKNNHIFGQVWPGISAVRFGLVFNGLAGKGKEILLYFW